MAVVLPPKTGWDDRNFAWHVHQILLVFNVCANKLVVVKWTQGLLFLAIYISIITTSLLGRNQSDQNKLRVLPSFRPAAPSHALPSFRHESHCTRAFGIACCGCIHSSSNTFPYLSNTDMPDHHSTAATTTARSAALRERGGGGHVCSSSEDERDDHHHHPNGVHHTSLLSKNVVDKSGKAASYYNAQKRRISYQSIWRDLKLRWRLLSTYSRVVVGLLSLVLAQHVVFGTLDVLFRQAGGRIGDNNYKKGTFPLYKSTETQYSVVINTYKRPDMLKEAVRHYAVTCGPQTGVRQVFVVWAELDKTPPTPEELLLLPGSAKRLGHASKNNSQQQQQQQPASVEIIRVAKDSLNSRFLPIANTQSQAIFMVDDDVRVDCPSLYMGFDAWRANPDAMVGYYPRLAIAHDNDDDDKKGDSSYVYQAWPGVYWRRAANFVLTKAAFLHHKYMVLYSDPDRHPQAILDYVDQYKNCEDVAMSLLVANQTIVRHRGGNDDDDQDDLSKSLIYVEGHVSDKGLRGGISSSGKTRHFNRRAECLQDMTRMYAAHGWKAPLRRSVDLRQVAWIQHYPGFAWQFRPSNFFEWLAFTNMFKS